MNQEAMLNKIMTELMELKAQVSQLGPVRKESSVKEEIAEIRAQGGDIAAYFKAKGRIGTKTIGGTK